jgi:hypothetical protein
VVCEWSSSDVNMITRAGAQIATNAPSASASGTLAFD